MPATYYDRKTPSTGTLTRRFVQNTDQHSISVSVFVVLSLELCLRTRFTVATKIRRQMVLLFRFVIG
jgi:hypothetical protein